MCLFSGFSTGEPCQYKVAQAEKARLKKEGQMSCNSCHSQYQRNLNGEIAIHFPGLEGLNKPIVWVFPELLVCLSCGFTEFEIPEAQLQELAESDAAPSNPN